MSVNTDPTKGCIGKQRFETFTQADRIARRTAKRRSKAMSAYHCQHCQGFHFGSHQRKQRFHVELTTQRDQP